MLFSLLYFVIKLCENLEDVDSQKSVPGEYAGWTGYWVFLSVNLCK